MSREHDDARKAIEAQVIKAMHKQGNNELINMRNNYLQ